MTVWVKISTRLCWYIRAFFRFSETHPLDICFTTDRFQNALVESFCIQLMYSNNPNNKKQFHKNCFISIFWVNLLFCAVSYKIWLKYKTHRTRDSMLRKLTRYSIGVWLLYIMCVKNSIKSKWKLGNNLFNCCHYWWISYNTTHYSVQILFGLKGFGARPINFMWAITQLFPF